MHELVALGCSQLHLTTLEGLVDWNPQLPLGCWPTKGGSSKWAFRGVQCVPDYKRVRPAFMIEVQLTGLDGDVKRWA